MNPIIPLGIGTVLLLLCLFAMGAFRLCEPTRRDDNVTDDDQDDGERERRRLMNQSEIVRDGSYR